MLAIVSTKRLVTIPLHQGAHRLGAHVLSEMPT